MSSYNDAWFMNESLAFYMSTNTFTNPIFDAMIESSPSPNASDHRLAEQVAATNKDKAKNKGVKAFYWRPQASFCDSFAFSFRSKMYVLELDFKRILQCLRRFADRRMPWLLSHTHRAPTAGQGGYSSIDRSRFITPQQQQVNYNDNDKFWSNYVGPDSRESLGAQKEKILYRLEQAIEEKRNNYNRELFNMNDGLPFVRPLDATSSQTTSTSLSSACSTPLSSECSQDLKVKNGAPSRGTNKLRKARWNFSIGQQQQPGNHDDDPGCKKLCVVCYTNLPNIVTLPCKHDEICSDCFIELIYVAVKHSRYPLKCVLCRQKIERIRCSRSLLLSVIKKNRITP